MAVRRVIFRTVTHKLTLVPVILMMHAQIMLIVRMGTVSVIYVLTRLLYPTVYMPR